jgi:hypothetical protein
MHSQLASGPALISTVFLEHRQDEPLLEFAYRLGIKNIALVHLQDECFELISHGIPLSFEKLPSRFSLFARFRFDAADVWLLVLLFTVQQIESLIKARP